MRLVIDTNVLVSYLCWPRSPIRPLVDDVLEHEEILCSVETFAELSDVLMCRKFDAYLSMEKRTLFLSAFYDNSQPALITERINDCRDSRDNKFLELAVCGKANFILSGDADLLALDPFRGIRIVNPAGFPTNKE